MPQMKQGSKRKRRKETVPVLGAVGVSLSLAGGASAATVGTAPDVQSMPPRDGTFGHELTLSEEELSDVSLGTFYVFDKENAGARGVQYARGCGRGCGGCRGCRGCRGCARGCGGCGGCGCGCSCCWQWGICRLC
jgi:hypothetical protein